MTGAGDVKRKVSCGWRSSLCLQLVAGAWFGFFFFFLASRVVSASRIEDSNENSVTKYEACGMEFGS